MTDHSDLPSISVVMAVGGNRADSCGEIVRGVRSILNQDYEGELEVILVVDPDNSTIRQCSLPNSVRFLNFTRPPGLKGRDANARWKFGWDHARGQILASTGAFLEWKGSNASIAVEIMRTQGVEAVDGIVRRSPGDTSFIGLFRDEALISEFAPFRKDIRLTPDTMAACSRLPTYVTFFMTRSFFNRVKDSLLVESSSDSVWGGTCWDDFCTASAMVKAGGEIYCTNRLVAYLLHGSTFRIHKQFSSGVSGARYCWDHPGDRYARRRLTQTILVATALMFASLSTAALTARHGLIGLGFCVLVLVIGFLLAGIVNSVKAKDWRAFFFPPLTFVQVLVWTCGALYASITDKPDEEFLAGVSRNR